MPPPYRQGHASGLVPGGNPTTTRRMANPQPCTPGHRTPLPGSPRQRNHHERGGDTGPAPTPHQTHGKTHGGSSAPPARSSPQSSGPNGTPQTPPVNTRGATPPPPGNTCSVSSITMPCMTQTSANPLCSPHAPPIPIRRPPRHHHSAPKPISHPRSPPAPPSPAEPNQGQPYVDVDAQDTDNPSSQTSPDPGHPPPHTGHHPRHRPTPRNPPRQGPDHPPGLVPPTGGLDQAHRQSPPGPDHPRQRPPRGHRRPRTLASPQTQPRPARLDPPDRVGPGPDRRHRHQRHTLRDRTPTTGPSGEGPPSRPEPPGAVETGHRTNPRHCPPRRRPPHP